MLFRQLMRTRIKERLVQWSRWPIADLQVSGSKLFDTRDTKYNNLILLFFFLDVWFFEFLNFLNIRKLSLSRSNESLVMRQSFLSGHRQVLAVKVVPSALWYRNLCKCRTFLYSIMHASSVSDKKVIEGAHHLRVEFLLKTDSGYPRDVEVTLFTLANPGSSLRFNAHLVTCHATWISHIQRDMIHVSNVPSVSLASNMTWFMALRWHLTRHTSLCLTFSWD